MAAASLSVHNNRSNANSKANIPIQIDLVVHLKKVKIDYKSISLSETARDLLINNRSLAKTKTTPKIQGDARPTENKSESQAGPMTHLSGQSVCIYLTALKNLVVVDLPDDMSSVESKNAVVLMVS